MNKRLTWLCIPPVALCLLEAAMMMTWQSADLWLAGLVGSWALLLTCLLIKLSDTRAALYLSAAITLFHAWGAASWIDEYPGGSPLSLLFYLLTALLLSFAWRQVTSEQGKFFVNPRPFKSIAALQRIPFILFVTMLMYCGAGIRGLFLKSAEYLLGHFLASLTYLPKFILYLAAALFILLNLNLFGRRTKRRPAVRFLRKALVGVYLAAFLVSLYLFMPPFRPVITAKRPIIEKISDEQNAWTDYKTALQVIGDFEQQPLENRSPNLGKFARGEMDLNEKQQAYLKKNLKALDYLKAGVERPRAQFTSGPISVDTPVPNFSQMESLAEIATAQARLLQMEGRANEAARLSLAVYHMGTDLAEKDAPIIYALISVEIRDAAMGALFYGILQGAYDTQTLLEIASEMSELDRRLPSAAEVMDAQWGNIQYGLEDILILKPEADSSIPDSFINPSKLPRGMRLRIYNSIIRQHPPLAQSVRPSLARWDFKGVKNATEEIERHLAKWRWTAWMEDILARRMIRGTFAITPGVMKALYDAQADSAALRTLAAVAAYRKIHGEFPASLEMVMGEVGLDVPLDPATGSSIGYRLEHGRPVVWLAGVDGVDNGGRKAEAVIDLEKEGNDLVYQFGEMAFTPK